MLDVGDLEELILMYDLEVFAGGFKLKKTMIMGVVRSLVRFWVEF